jgi:hypothetical protein
MTIDLTGVATSIIGAFLSAVVTVFLAWLSSHMKDQTAAATIGAAVKNAVGIVQQAADAGIRSHPLQFKLPPGTPAATAAGVQYVLDHAGPELKRFTGITLDAVTDKVVAQIGLAKLATAAPVPLAPLPHAA